MIDFLCIRAYFSRHTYSSFTDDHALLHQSVIDSLSLKKSLHYDEDGNLINTSIPWHSVRSDFSSMAFKVNLPSRSGQPFIEFKASPAKLFQGHNVFGSDDIRFCIKLMVETLIKEYPVLSIPFLCNGQEFPIIRWDWAEIMYIDCTYHSWATTNKEALDFINAVKFISNRHVKSAIDGRSGLQTYNQTAYWNPTSEHRRLKVYHKSSEVDFQRSKLKTDFERAKHDAIFNKPMHDYMQGMLRWEARVYKRKLKTAGYEVRCLPYLREKAKKSNGSAVQVKEARMIFAREIWEMAFKDLFKAFEGQDMKMVTNSDDFILKKLRKSIHIKRTYSRKIMLVGRDYTEYTKLEKLGYSLSWAELVTDEVQLVWLEKNTVNTGQADSAFQTYQDIKRIGFKAAEKKHSKRTWYRNLDHLRGIGITTATLQNYRSENADQPKVIPFVRFAKVRFDQQIPSWAS